MRFDDVPESESDGYKENIMNESIQSSIQEDEHENDLSPPKQSYKNERRNIKEDESLNESSYTQEDEQQAANQYSNP